VLLNIICGILKTLEAWVILLIFASIPISIVTNGVGFGMAGSLKAFT
jgi:hypothetical protein